MNRDIYQLVTINIMNIHIYQLLIVPCLSDKHKSQFPLFLFLKKANICINYSSSQEKKRENRTHRTRPSGRFRFFFCFFPRPSWKARTFRPSTPGPTSSSCFTVPNPRRAAFFLATPKTGRKLGMNQDETIGQNAGKL